MAAEPAEPAEFAQPPCREAGKYVAPCPLCGRTLSLKTLRYRHVCWGAQLDTEAHALSQQAAAEKAVRLRMAARAAASPGAPAQKWSALLAASLGR
jgi:hypothetical protein